jgi:phosphinothricin acetyltransferase
MSPGTTLIRPCQTADLPAVTAIYAHHVSHGSGSFELEPPSLQDMTQRHAHVTQLGLPWLVATRHQEVLGFAYAGQFRPRPGFQYLVEDSVYIQQGHAGQGLGVALLAELIRCCEQAGKRQMLAVIGDSANAGSIALHARLGFIHTGILKASGWKHGRWLDTVLMQKALGPGQSVDPA